MEEERITSIEVKLAYMEDFINRLQDVVVEQGKSIDALKVENRVLKNKVTEFLDNQEGDIPNVKPPHY